MNVFMHAYKHCWFALTVFMNSCTKAVHFVHFIRDEFGRLLTSKRRSFSSQQGRQVVPAMYLTLKYLLATHSIYNSRSEIDSPCSTFSYTPKVLRYTCPQAHFITYRTQISRYSVYTR